MRKWNCFVLMPFAEEFADVYWLLRDVQAAPEVPPLHIYRADDISEPGRITDQVLTAIRDCDLVIADVTGSNPNVMFELGYARALGKPAIIINQDVAASPFDIAEMRQIVYDRRRLGGDLRPQVTTIIKTTLAKLLRGAPPSAADSALEDARHDSAVPPPAGEKADRLNVSIMSADQATIKLEAIEVEVELGREDKDNPRLRELSTEAKEVVDAVDVTAEGEADLKHLAGEIGDLAVEFHNAAMYREAEDLFNRALKVYERHPGVHMQYALYYAIHKRDGTKAEELLKRAEGLGADPSRLESARTQLRMIRAHRSEFVDPGLLNQVRERAEANPTDFEQFGAYTLLLMRSQAWEDIVRIGEAGIRSLGEGPSTQDGYRFRRVYADAIAMSNDPKHEAIAARLYAEILGVRPDDAEVLSNYATLLMKGPIQEQMKAVAHYLRGFQIAPTQTKLQGGFARALKRLVGRKDLVAKVLRGQRFTEAEIAQLNADIEKRRTPPQ